ncbi:MAG: CAP domain-containing protein [Terriglobales bacterium]
MIRALIASLAIFLATSVVGLEVSAAQAREATAPGEAQPSPYYDAEAGRLLLEMANRERAKAGLPALQADDGLTKAALAHAAAMAAQQELSHQLSGEPSLVHRLAANSKTHLDQSGENVAFANSVDQAQDSLMHSPPHRANLLNAGYNVAGFSVVRRGSLLYVTQDFGHSLPSRSDAEAEVLVGRSVDRLRAQSHLPGLQRMDGKEAASTACAMAEADSLRTPGPKARAVLRYTTSEPQVLPENAAGVIKDRSLGAFAAGSCYARTRAYPTGVYWVALFFY